MKKKGAFQWTVRRVHAFTVRLSSMPAHYNEHPFRLFTYIGATIDIFSQSIKCHFNGLTAAKITYGILAG